MPEDRDNRKIRYAVVGLGHIAQAAILPAFAHTKNSEIAALVSRNPEKNAQLGKLYGVERTCSYEQFEECLTSGTVDAVYIALPNDLHREFTVRAAHCGVHVLCEKPMAVTQNECAEMISACSDKDVKLMVAYRLHFEAANLKAVEVAQSGELGDLRLFDSVFSMQVRPGNIRVQRSHGGGSVYDIGIYCLNAARYVFRDDPIEVFACQGTNGDARFKEVDEMMSGILRFPHERLATWTCSFNGPGVQRYTIHGTKGLLTVDPAYDYAEELKHVLKVDKKSRETVFPKRDQFAAELTYFSDCILNDQDPEPDGWEGMADVRVIEAIYKSAQSSQPVKLQQFPRNRDRPDTSQLISCAPPEEPKALVGVEAPTLD